LLQPAFQQQGGGEGVHRVVAIAAALTLGQAILAEARAFRAFAIGDPTAQAHAACTDAADEPQHAVLACRKILNTFGIKPRAWRSGLPSLLDRFYRHV